MSKIKKYMYTVEDYRTAYIRGIEEGKREAFNEIIRALRIDDYVALKIAEHEAEKHNE